MSSRHSRVKEDKQKKSLHSHCDNPHYLGRDSSKSGKRQSSDESSDRERQIGKSYKKESKRSYKSNTNRTTVKYSRNEMEKKASRREKRSRDDRKNSNKSEDSSSDDRRRKHRKRSRNSSSEHQNNPHIKQKSLQIEGRSREGSRYWDYEGNERQSENDGSNQHRKGFSNEIVGSRYYGNFEKSEKVSSHKADKSSREGPNEVKNNPPSKKNVDPISSKTGGAYIPPAMLKLMQASITDKSSPEYQRIAWEALKKSIHGLINKVNRSNIDTIIKQLLKENIVRGRGLLTRSIIQAQGMSLTFTCVYAALAALINSRFPNIGELLLKRLVIQFKRGFKRNDKISCIAAATFIAHLVNQRVAHEILALEILTLLVDAPTDDSVEVAISFLKECGMKLTEVSKKGVDAIFEMLRNVLHENKVDKRVEYMIEVMFQVRKDKFKDNEAIPDGLDLVEDEDQFTHLITLDDATDGEDILNVFKVDPEYAAHEEKYKELSKEMIGDSDESGAESGSDSATDEDDDDDNSDDDNEGDKAAEKQIIVDNTETNLVALRRTIYLAIYSSLEYEECAHKLMKMQLKPGQEPEVCAMILDCCCEMRSYERFYGLLAERFCQVNRAYIPPFEALFKDTYSTVHRLKTNQCRNVAKLFGHLLFTDAISWDVLSCIRLNEEDTTSSGRIFIKILFHELSEYMGLVKLNDRVKDSTLQSAFAGLFPRDNPRHTRFSINFFTSIGLGGLTDELREHLTVAIQAEAALLPEVALDSSTSSSSSSSDDSSDETDSSSDDSSIEVKKVTKSKNKKREKSKTAHERSSKKRKSHSSKKSSKNK